jgi:hypothetical protein
LFYVDRRQGIRELRLVLLRMIGDLGLVSDGGTETKRTRAT